MDVLNHIHCCIRILDSIHCIYSGFRMLWAEEGCIASEGIFFFVNLILVNALFYFPCKFVNVLSCFNVCIDCKIYSPM